jgi:hypothetical protein
MRDINNKPTPIDALHALLNSSVKDGQAQPVDPSRGYTVSTDHRMTPPSRLIDRTRSQKLGIPSHGQIQRETLQT